MASRLTSLGLIFAGLGVAWPVAASEYCVVCYAPDARYRCMTNDGHEGQGSDQRAWLQCITLLAKGGGHDSCSIDRASAAPCLGVVKPIGLATMDGEDAHAGARAAPPAPGPGAAGSGAAGSGAPATGSAASGEPAPRAPGGASNEPAAPEEPGVLEKSKQGLENAGSAVGNAAKKSWDCMSSLFKKC